MNDNWNQQSSHNQSSGNGTAHSGKGLLRSYSQQSQQNQKPVQQDFPTASVGDPNSSMGNPYSPFPVGPQEPASSQYSQGPQTPFGASGQPPQSSQAPQDPHATQHWNPPAWVENTVNGTWSAMRELSGKVVAMGRQAAENIGTGLHTQNSMMTSARTSQPMSRSVGPVERTREQV
jgi:hypothetical protein